MSQPKKNQPTQIRDRIKELRRVKASDLKSNPKNWRTHPKEQAAALQGVLQEIGYAGALLARETPGGGLMLIDGHLRAETTPDALVPVLVLDVDEAEADKLLLTFDPLAAMAERNQEAFDKLARETEITTAALRKMVDEQMAGFSPDFVPVGIDEQGRLDEKKKIKCPECGHEFTN